MRLFIGYTPLQNRKFKKLWAGEKEILFVIDMFVYTENLK